MCIAQDSGDSSLPISPREEVGALLALFAPEQDMAQLQAHINRGRSAARAAADSDVRATRATSEGHEAQANLHGIAARWRWELARHELGRARVLQRNLTRDVRKDLLNEE